MSIPEKEIREWLFKQNYQSAYDETGEYLMYFSVDMPKILNDFVNQFRNPPKKTIEERRVEFSDKVYNTASMYQVCSSMPMIIDFINYWTEHSEGAKKMRFEKEKVFDIKKRLDRWKRNQKQPTHGRKSADEAIGDLLSN